MTMPLDAHATDEPDEAALLARYARGDAAAVRALTLRLTPRAYAQAMRLLGDRAEAEDVAQDAMMRLWKIAPDWRAGEAKVTTWLYRVVAYLCTDRLRRSPRGPLALNEVAALATLPERQRMAVMLRHFEGATNPEIAERLGVSVEAVESLTARGKRALAAALKGQAAALGYEG